MGTVDIHPELSVRFPECRSRFPADRARPDDFALLLGKGYWRMSSNRIVQQALSNRWLEEQGVPDMRTLWIRLHYGPKARV